MGFHHKIQVGSFITPESPNISLTLNDFNKSDQDTLMAKMITLDFAYMCLKNSLTLLPTNQQIFADKSNDSVLNQLKSSSASRLGMYNMDNLEDQAFSSNLNDSNDLDSILADSNETNETSSSRVGFPKQGVQQKLFNCVWPSKPINLAELQNLRSSILVSLAYVSLCLKDYLNTVKYCNILLDNEDPLNSKYPVSKGNK